MIENQLKNSQPSVDLYVICTTKIDCKSGSIMVNTASNPYTDANEATRAMKEMYDAELKAYGLEDNDACDKESEEAIPGGYFTNDEAGIYTYADFAFGQLLEVVSFVVKRIEIDKDIQSHINACSKPNN